MGDRHVGVVGVRSFLTVDLDAGVVFVHEGRHFLVLEGLVFHDVAPVAGGVAYGKEDRFVQPGRLLEGFGSPGAPVDGVAGMLQQVGTALEDQAVEFLATVLGQPVNCVLGRQGRAGAMRFSGDFRRGPGGRRTG